MRKLLALLWFAASTMQAQVPEAGTFRYELFDNSDRRVGTYSFTIVKEGRVWRIASEMDVDTEVFFLKVRLRDHNNFTHDGQTFLSFQVKYFKDVPLQKTVDKKIEGRLEGSSWTLTSMQDGKEVRKNLPATAFTEVRNLISRLISPEAIVRPGEKRKALSLDPLTFQVDHVESRGLREESVDFQGKKRHLYVIEQKADDGDVLVKKFDNGLIYHSQTAEGYALLQSAVTPEF
ncbi:MAG: hypothetical protein M3Q07_11550 [Pseudobdellovibrionaceae bacterium]|nr:hypothetical protein [Pseudobdellovibrionaceae bacterium]